MEDRSRKKRQRSLGIKVMFQVGWLTAGPASGESRMARGVDARENVLARCNTMEAFREQPDGLTGRELGQKSWVRCSDKDGRKALASRDGQVMVTWATSARKFGRQRYATTYEFNCALESVLSNPCLLPCPLLPLPVLV